MNSKLPWNKSGNGIECADRYRVGSVNSIGTREGIANMDLIVAAVNEHAALVAVAEAATKVSDAVAEGCSSEAAYLLGLNQNLIEALASLAAVRGK